MLMLDLLVDLGLFGETHRGQEPNLLVDKLFFKLPFEAIDKLKNKRSSKLQRFLKIFTIKRDKSTMIDIIIHLCNTYKLIKL